MGKFRITAVLLFLFTGDFFTGNLALAQQHVTARQLVRTVDSALGDLAKAASEPRGGLDAKDPKAAPFWSTLNGLRIRVLMIESALSRRDGEFFTLLDQGSTDLGALRVSWARAGVNNAQAVRNLRIASTSYRMLRANYGREGMRLRRGGDLSEAEQRQFQRLQRTQRRFAESLRALREQARRQDDRVSVAELDRFRADAERIVLAPSNLESYLNSLIASSEVRGEWEANAPYLKQEAAPEDFVVANEMVEDLYVESDIGHVFTADLGAADEGPDFFEQEVVVQEDVEVEREAIQVYELGYESVADEVVLVEEDAAPEAPFEIFETGPSEDLPEAAAPEGEIFEEDMADLTDPADEVQSEDIEDIEDIEDASLETAPAGEKKEGAAEDGTQTAPVPVEPVKPHPKKPPIG